MEWIGYGILQITRAKAQPLIGQDERDALASATQQSNEKENRQTADAPARLDHILHPTSLGIRRL
jgi:hypothetical protein